MRKAKLKLLYRFFLIALILTLISLMYFYYEIHSIEVKKYTVLIKNLPANFNSFRILQISDLHSKEFEQNQEKLIKIIRKYKYDAVALTGDFYDYKNTSLKPTLSLAKQLKKPIYYVPGNHEWLAGYKIQKPLQALGVKVLRNKSDKFSIGGQHLWLVGVDDPITRRDRLGKALKNIKDVEPKILLAHSPKIFSKAIDDKLDLVLVGHTHGGQVRFPVLGPIFAPGQGFFPKYHYGRFREGKTTMIINAGLGESGLPIRANNKPEVVLITLRSTKHQITNDK